MNTIKKGYKVPEKPLLADWQVRAIYERIKEVLRLRGITVRFTVTLLESDYKGKQSLQIESDPFNTWPVIHSEIELTAFGGGVWEDKRTFEDGTKIDIVQFSVPVHVSYEGNGTGLFVTHGEVQKREYDHMFFDEEKHSGSRILREHVSQSNYEKL